MNNSILLIILFNYLRKVLETRETDKKLDNILIAGMVICLAFIGFAAGFPVCRPFIKYIAHAAMIAMMVVVIITPRFKPAKLFVYALMPLALVDLFSDIIEKFFPVQAELWDNYINAAAISSLVWLVAMMIVNGRQRKAIKKEREKLLAAEQDARRAEEMKRLLEIQVAERTAELSSQKAELQKALEELKAAQQQLIQNEKMASLGELTAGIAHEIQNPLNFVNNFSELNSELIKELRNEVTKGDLEEVNALLNDIETNSDKITHHGKRADGIVKGMLQHSRASTGQKEMTDINALCDEYLRLSYHGLRAKDKTFNAKFETDFDNSIEKINIVPQDIGRVILNLINNAFYAVSEKQKMHSKNYEPAVTVSTKRNNRSIEIKVTDNGNGIPDAVKDKIFQPFFTTKPTGLGTGLGLSLSYDIITKGHGGELKVETKEGEGTSFIIRLPVA